MRWIPINMFRIGSVAGYWTALLVPLLGAHQVWTGVLFTILTAALVVWDVRRVRAAYSDAGRSS